MARSVSVQPNTSRKDPPQPERNGRKQKSLRGKCSVKKDVLGTYTIHNNLFSNILGESLPLMISEFAQSGQFSQAWSHLYITQNVIQVKGALSRYPYMYVYLTVSSQDTCTNVLLIPQETFKNVPHRECHSSALLLYCRVWHISACAYNCQR